MAEEDLKRLIESTAAETGDTDESAGRVPAIAEFVLRVATLEDTIERLKIRLERLERFNRPS